MRTVTVEILKAALGSVEQVLEDSGFERFDSSTGQWNYPPGGEAVLYAVCKPYSADDLENEPSLHTLLGGTLPTVEVMADVSGRVEGEAEVRHLVECLLSVFEGFALDDFTSHEHAWTLEEIRNGDQFKGLGFFDYRGAYAQSRNAVGGVVAAAE